MRLFFAIIIATSSAFVSSTTDGAELSFLEKTFRFPNTHEGVLLKHDFIFTNSGSQPLIISSYSVACSCTKAEFPTYPILPGNSDTLKVSFDTNGKYGYQYRKIAITSNASKKPVEIGFKVNVIPKN